MRKHMRFWISIVASALVFPMAAIAMFTVWLIRLDLPQPTIADPSPATLAATPPAAPVRTRVEAAVTAPLEAKVETAAPHSAVQTQPAAEALSPQPKQQTAEMAEATAPQPNVKMSEPVFVPTMTATIAVEPPIQSNKHAADADPIQDTSPSATFMPTEPPTSEPARLMEVLIRLPRPKPRFIVANGSRTTPLPRLRPVQNSPHPGLSQQ